MSVDLPQLKPMQQQGSIGGDGGSKVLTEQENANGKKELLADGLEGFEETREEQEETEEMRLQQQIKTLRGEMGQLNAQMLSYKQEADLYRNQLLQAKSQTIYQQQQIKQLNEKCGQQQQKSNEELLRELSISEKLRRQVVDLEERLSEESKRCQDLEMKLQETTQSYEIQFSQLKQQLTNTQDDVKKATDKMIENAKVAKLEFSRELDQLTSSISDYRKRNCVLATQLEGSTAQILQLKATNALLEEKLQMAHTAMQDARNAMNDEIQHAIKMAGSKQFMEEKGALQQLLQGHLKVQYQLETQLKACQSDVEQLTLALNQANAAKSGAEKQFFDEVSAHRVTKQREQKLQEQIERYKAMVQTEELPRRLMELEKIVINQRELIAQLRMARPTSAANNQLPIIVKSPQILRPGTAAIPRQKTPPKFGKLPGSALQKGQSKEDLIRQFQIQQIALHIK